jgi:glycolate oxidase FAD binding subunit
MPPPARANQHLDDLTGLVGPSHVRSAEANDAIDGVRPALVVEPADADAVAAVLAWASSRRASLVLRGGGTRFAWGRTPSAVDLIVSTRRLSRILHHEPGDLTVSVEAGMPLAALNRALAAHGQWLPLDVPSDASTIGGLLAVNDSGPLRHRHGAPRDLLIGTQLATTDGRVVKSGGNVVKNVAGYDLGRLLCGSFGSLAAIVSATFKLAPVPPATASLAGDLPHAEALAGAAAVLASSQLDPVGLDVRIRVDADVPADTHRLLVRFGGLAAVNNAQMASTRFLAAPFRPASFEILANDAEASAWHAQTRGAWTSSGSLVKLSWLPAALPAVASLMGAIARREGLVMTLTARAALGTGTIQVDGTAAAQATAVRELRRRTDVVTHVVLARADTAVKALVDVWGPSGDTAPLLARIKATLDPAGILNAGRGPL